MVGMYHPLCRYKQIKHASRYHANPKFLPFPSKYISIRGIEEEKYAVIDVTSWERSEGQAEILEEIEFSRAIFEVRICALVVRVALIACDFSAVRRWRRKYFNSLVCFDLMSRSSCIRAKHI